MDEPTSEDIDLAHRLYVEWDEGRGTSKSQIELREWGDATAHGRRFDRFIRKTLGFSTTKPSRQTDRIGELEAAIRRSGRVPPGAKPARWEVQLQHARSAALAALRAWNDPTPVFRTGSFSLLLVTAWNSLAIAILQQGKAEWRELDKSGQPTLFEGMEKSRDTLDLIKQAFPGDASRGLRENIADWVALRNSVAHRHLPALDVAVIPLAQAGLLNFENALESNFGADFLLAEQLSVPLQLSGFRDPGVLSSLKKLQASLPLDVQAILSRAEQSDPDLLSDHTYMLRVAFIPAVPASGRNPDAVAYFVKPGQVTGELEEAVQQFVVLPKVSRSARPNLGAKSVVDTVKEATGFKFNTTQHAFLTRKLGVRPEKDAADPAKTDLVYCEYISAMKNYLYSQAWVDRLVALLSTEDGYREELEAEPVPLPGKSAE